MSYGTLNTTISRQNIVDQVAALLYAMKVVPDDVDIQNIQFSELFGNSDIELVKLTIQTKGIN